MRRSISSAVFSALLFACTGESPLTLTARDAEISNAPDALHDAGVNADAEETFADAEASHDAAIIVDDAGLVHADAETFPDAEPVGLGPRCFPEIFDPNSPGPNYDQFSPIAGAHCFGTNHQTITGVEKVVFLGDSVTQGTPPTPLSERYRQRLTGMLEDHFGELEVENCAAWGARTDDLLDPPNQQVHECFPEAEPKRTLVIMTIGGNDIASVTKDGAEGAPIDVTRPLVEQFVQKMRDAIHWFKDDPARFPNGVFIIFANMYEFTDGTGDVTSCPAAGLAGFDQPWPDAEPLVIWANEQYMQIAVETGTDLIFMLEHFCGHGFHNDDPNTRCYRGPNTERWFDLTCIHPNPTGHEQIANMFMNVVLE
jgi:lysophospholipase L1-like esterase